eukprot:16442116-Heterocapsa_arctica.AAC.1
MIPLDAASRAYPSTIELYIEYGTDHIAMVFDRLMGKLNENRSRQDYTIISEINQRTKANIIQSILGLGHIYRQHGFIELLNLPQIVNDLETELRYHDMRMMHKTRGQHPAGPSGSNQWEDEDNEIMMVQIPTNTTERMRPVPLAPTIAITEDSEEDDMMGYQESMREEEAELVREQQLQEDILIQDAQDAMRQIDRGRVRSISSGTDEELTTTARNVRQRSEPRIQ